MVTQRAIVRHYEQNEASALGLVQQYGELADELADTIEDLKNAAAEAREALALAYLSAVEQPLLERAEELTGYRGFSRRDPLKAMDRERRVLQRTIAEIEADERYRKRAVLVGPGGPLTQAVDEAKDMLAPWEADCDRFEGLPGFMDLLDLRYDTPEFSLSFWQPSYWAVWATGDAICEALDMDDFGDDVLPAYRVVAGHRAIWQQQVAEAEAKVKEVHDLTQRRDQAEARIPHLPEIYLQQCHKQLAAYFADADLALLETWLRDVPAGDEPDRGVLMALRRASGAAAKVGFVKELLDEGVRPAVDGFRQRKAKYARKAQKYQRPKYGRMTFGERDMDPKFLEKQSKYAERPGKIRRLVRSLLEYDGYDRFDLANNDQEAWFGEMTRKSPPSMLPKTRRWYARHGTVEVLHDELLEERRHEAIAAATVAVAAADHLGYLS